MTGKRGFFYALVFSFALGSVGCGDTIADNVLGSDKGQAICEEYSNTCTTGDNGNVESNPFSMNCDALMRSANNQGCGEEVRAYFNCAVQACRKGYDQDNKCGNQQVEADNCGAYK